MQYVKMDVFAMSDLFQYFFSRENKYLMKNLFTIVYFYTRDHFIMTTSVRFILSFKYYTIGFCGLQREHIFNENLHCCYGPRQ